MAKTIKRSALNATIKSTCNNLRNNFDWSDEDCITFAANLIEVLDKYGWKIEEG